MTTPYMTLTVHGDHIDVHCRDCETIRHTSQPKPIRACNEAEVAGWKGGNKSGRYGMLCPECVGGGAG